VPTSPFQAHACRRTREYVSLHLDSELSELEEALLNSHLARCPACAAYAQGVEAFTSALRGTPLAEPSVEFALPRRTRRFGSAQLGSAAGAVITVAVAALIAVPGFHSSQSRFSALDVQRARKEMSFKEQQLTRIDGLPTGPSRPQAGVRAAEGTALSPDRSTG
jgi:anti-sigma factor RsiW